MEYRTQQPPIDCKNDIITALGLHKFKVALVDMTNTHKGDRDVTQKVKSFDCKNLSNAEAVIATILENIDLPGRNSGSL